MGNPHFAFTGGTRHSTEVDYHAFRREHAHELKKAGIDIGKPPQGEVELRKLSPAAK